MKLLALTKYDAMAASTRQRFMQFEPALRRAGIRVERAPLLGNDHIERLTAGRRASPFAVLVSYVRRLRLLLSARQYDALWVYCELFPYWPGLIERLARVSGKPVVVDIDDAIFHQYDSSPHWLVRRLLGRKLVPLLKRATVCCCGNDYLRAYAAQYCRRTIVLPTVVDTDRYRPAGKRVEGALVIGWIGSPSTWAYVRPLLPVLRRLAEQHGVIIRAVGAGNAARRDAFPGLEHVAWSEAEEIAAVQSMDIGIMPVTDGPFARGKCGYKLIQYMACGLPVVASPVGVNQAIVDDGSNGFLASDEGEWRTALLRLIGDRELREAMGRAGRSKVERDYSLAVHAPRLVELFQSIGVQE